MGDSFYTEGRDAAWLLLIGRGTLEYTRIQFQCAGSRNVVTPPSGQVREKVEANRAGECEKGK